MRQIIIPALSIAWGLHSVVPSPPPPPTLDEIIEREAQINAVPSAVIRAIITVESSWDPDALSHKGAMGLMQVMPANAKYCGYTPKEMYQPEPNVICGTRIYAEEKKRFGNRKDALRAYNQGSPRAKTCKMCGAKYAKKVLKVVG
jgi:soluble lytic murein transglycosylase-like protein